MFRKLSLLLILTVSSTVLSLNQDSEKTLSRSLCLLAFGANAENTADHRPMKILNTECQPDCDFEKKQIVFCCKNYKGKFFIILWQNFSKWIFHSQKEVFAMQPKKHSAVWLKCCLANLSVLPTIKTQLCTLNVIL